MEKQKVFIPVDVNDRSDPIPNKSNVIILFDNDEVRRMNDNFPFAIATHWLNEQEGYFFTPEELKELVAECVGFVWGRYGTEKDREEQCKKLIESLNIK